MGVLFKLTVKKKEAPKKQKPPKRLPLPPPTTLKMKKEEVFDPKNNTIERLNEMYGEIFPPNTPVTWRVNLANKKLVVRQIALKMGPKSKDTGREESVLIRYEREEDGQFYETWVSTRNVKERVIDNAEA